MWKVHNLLLTSPQQNVINFENHWPGHAVSDHLQTWEFKCLVACGHQEHLNRKPPAPDALNSLKKNQLIFLIHITQLPAQCLIHVCKYWLNERMNEPSVLAPSFFYLMKSRCVCAAIEGATVFPQHLFTSELTWLSTKLPHCLLTAQWEGKKANHFLYGPSRGSSHLQDIRHMWTITYSDSWGHRIITCASGSCREIRIH